VAACTATRNAIDQFDTFRGEPLEVGLDVVAAVGDVMQGRTPSPEEPPHGGLRAERFQEFDETHEGDADASVFEGLWSGTGFARQEFEETATLFDGVDGDRNVVEMAVRYRDEGHRRMLHSAPNGDKERWNGNERSNH